MGGLVKDMEKGRWKIPFFAFLLALPLIAILIFFVSAEEEKGMEKRYNCECRALGRDREVIVDIKIPSLNETGAFSFPVNINLSVGQNEIPCRCEPVFVD